MSVKENPVAMLLRTAGVTRREFAKRADLGEFTVTMIVTGQIPLNGRLVRAVASVCVGIRDQVGDLLEEHYGRRNLMEAYEGWRLNNRRQFRTSVQNTFWPTEATGPRSPAQQWTDGWLGSYQAVAKALCVNGGNLAQWARGRRATIPVDLFEALGDCGVERDATELARLQEEWRRAS